MFKFTKTACAAMGLLACSSLAVATGQSGHGTSSGHGSMSGHGSSATMADSATGTGVLEAVRASENVVNITHEPLPALGWPQMTMDLPVTRRVDLGEFKAGDAVEFEVKKGRDNVFRIVKMKPAK